MKPTIWSPRSVFPMSSSLWSNFFDDDDENNGFFNALSKKANIPAVNISEANGNFVLELAAPGLDKNDFKIEIEDNVLTISAEKEESSEKIEKEFSRKEYSYHSFKRSFQLPKTAVGEKVNAKYDNGILSIKVPKLEKAAQIAKTIPVV